jgi:ribosomal protein L29
MGEGYYEFDMEDEGPDYSSISSLEDELRRLIRFSNQSGSKGADAKIEQLKQRIAQLKNQINEKQEDPTDIIAMDVPLFLRMLEYAREDAEQDIDLHKVTERAIEAVKLRGLLSMEDYQDIVGEPIDEEIDYLSLKDDNPFDDVPSIDIQMIDDKEGVSSPKAFVNFSSMYHSGDNGKMEILRNNPALQDKVMQTLQAEFQKTFRRVIHGVLGEPFGLNEDAFEDTRVGNRKTAQSFIDQYKDNPFKLTDIKYVKAYLDIKDPIKANKYWNDFNLAGKTSGVSSMKSLQELVKSTLTEKKKKRDRCLRIADRKFDKPSAYKSSAATRCRQGEIWKDLK